MSDPIDDKALDEYLEGGSLVSQRYRELGGDEVPADLNRRVLDEARAAVAKRPARSRNWMRWSAPVALAASAVLVLSIVIDSGVQNGDVVMAPAPARQESAAARDAGAASERESASAPSSDVSIDAPEQAVQPEVLRFEPRPSEAEAPSARRMTEKKKEGAGITDRLQKSAPPAYTAAPAMPSSPTVASPAEMPVPSVASSAARAEAQLEDRSVARTEEITATARQQRPIVHNSSSAISVEEAIVTGTRRRDARSVGPRDTVRASSGQAYSSDADEQDAPPRTYSDPERWLEDIRQLRKDGEIARADREWERFRESFPDYAVADTDLARKK